MDGGLDAVTCLLGKDYESERHRQYFRMAHTGFSSMQAMAENPSMYTLYGIIG